ncbi:hypothetical protein IW261DRAFT_93000 [Armillaria novae-zelandiae]|uniref:Uncharacterized protein n=1 Tax=Armillaria novae-zelandiae TaxID=153914 RepID=A0AA39PXJ2_9AGAR|nr:hypothetical protein IW261DRAFT_93000 [Armillaria novae-zelandiae]
MYGREAVVRTPAVEEHRRVINFLPSFLCSINMLSPLLYGSLSSQFQVGVHGLGICITGYLLNVRFSNAKFSVTTFSLQ